jgi:AAA+ ATPase superfamily predicted ATPase
MEYKNTAAFINRNRQAEIEYLEKWIQEEPGQIRFFYGPKSIIIIDELQALDFIYFNSQRELIKEMINFFVAMTKESHLCHVLLSSSDGYFIEKLYNDSKLRKTSKLFEVDYLPESDIVYWLNNIDKEWGDEN